MATYDEMVGAYVKLRDMKKAIQDQQKKELEPINDKLGTLEASMLLYLNADGVESARTNHGTVYKLKRTRSKVEDWDVALSYILTNKLEHMLEKRVNKAAVEEFLEANGALPPGISLETELTVGIRRS